MKNNTNFYTWFCLEIIVFQNFYKIVYNVCLENVTVEVIKNYLWKVLQKLLFNVALLQAAVSWKFGHCSAHTPLKIWWIITHEH